MENLEERLTLETLPKAFTKLTNEVSEIKRLLLEISNETTPEPDKWFNIEELCKYHPNRPARQTVYQWVANNSIPVHKSTKGLRFLKSEVDSWLKTGNRKTVPEIVAAAETYLNKKGGGK